jgi:hypothetical protein
MGWVAKELWFNSWQVLEVFHFSGSSRLTVGPIQLPVQWVWDVVSWGLSGEGMMLTTVN